MGCMRSRTLGLLAGVLLVVPMAACSTSTRSTPTAPGAAPTSPPTTAAAPASTAGITPAAHAQVPLSRRAAGATAAALKPGAPAPLPSSVFRGIETLHPTGAVPGDQVMHVGISLASRDQAGAAAAMRALNTPSSPRYHKYFTSDEWDAAYGPDPAAVTAVTSWLTGGGLDVLQADGTYVYAAGTATQVQSLFAVTLQNFNVKGRTFFANLQAPRVPSGLGITSVLGLSNYKQARTFHHVAGTGPKAFPVSAATTAPDLWSIYDMPNTNKGDGQGLAVFGWSMDQKPIEKDLRQFELLYQLPSVRFSVKHFGKQDGSIGTPDTNPDDIIEWDLDTQASSGMAPNVSEITAYDAYSPYDVDLLAPIAAWLKDKNGSLQGSASYGECEEDPVFSSVGAPGSAASGTEDAWNDILKKAVATGRTLFVSTGDSGFGCNPAGATVNGVTLGPVPYQSWPAVSPNVVAVGGTVITTDDKTPPKRDVEYAWTHGGGGASPFVDQPDYQSSAGVPLPTRGVPDVAAQGGDIISGFTIVTGGEQTGVLGTSLSAPLLQGIWARVSAGSASGPGFANNSFYAVAAAHPDTFYDVTIGSNGLYQAGPGWDYTTGLGVPDVSKLIQNVDGTLVPVDAAGQRKPVMQPVCRKGAPALTDSPGDAIGLGLRSTPRPSEPDLDILTADAGIVGGNLVATMTVKTLSASSPMGSTGDIFDVGFHYGSEPYYLEASRSSGTVRGDFGAGSDANGTSFETHDAKATFDVQNSTVTVSVPVSTFNNHRPDGTAPLAQGSLLAAFTATTWQSELISGVVDDGTGQCTATA